MARHLPPFRGRTRVFLALFGVLRLSGIHTVFESTLLKPTPFTVRLDLHSWLQRIAFLTGGYEDDTVVFLLRLYDAYPRKGRFFDIGANIGLICIPFARMRPEAMVCAFEAVVDNFEVLEHNIGLNALGSRITPFAVALGDARKMVEIQVEGDLAPGEGTGTANIMAADSRWECVRIPLELRTLDELLERSETPADAVLIKIDTDGYDLKVLQGGRSVLRNSRPVVYGEFSAHCMNWHGQSVEDVRAFAREFDYEVWARKAGTWTFSDRIDKDGYTNDLLLVPAEMRPRYLWCLDPDAVLKAS